MNFNGINKIVMIDVTEGNGTSDPFRVVHYFFDLEQHGGTFGGFIGKVDKAKTSSAIGKETRMLASYPPRLKAP